MSTLIDSPVYDSASYPAPEANKPLKKRTDRMAKLITENFWLKASLPALAAAFMYNGYQTHQNTEALRHFRPIVIRVDETGRAEAVEYRNMKYVPDQTTIRYFLGDFANKFYRRSRATIADQWPDAFYFLEANLGNGLRMDAQKAGFPDKFVLGRDTQPECDIRIDNVVFAELPSAPTDIRKHFTGRIDFTKVFYNQAHEQAKTEKWTTQVWFTFTDKIENDLILKNPIGLVITSFDTKQAFTN